MKQTSNLTVGYWREFKVTYSHINTLKQLPIQSAEVLVNIYLNNKTICKIIIPVSQIRQNP